MRAIGVDIGGTKIEAQVFDAAWVCRGAERIETPRTYAGLLDGVARLSDWAAGQGGAGLPFGISSAGLMNPASGVLTAANLPAHGQRFAADLAARLGRGVVFLNDCRAQAVSEAQFGAAKGAVSALVINLGSGLSGAMIVAGRLAPLATGVGGEIGHFALPAAPVLAHGLPILPCGCGRMGCAETLISGPGLTRIAAIKTERKIEAAALAKARFDDAALAAVWQIWRALLTEWLWTLILAHDPEVIVLAGGLALAKGLLDEVRSTLSDAQFAGFALPELRLAAGGDATAARGAAYAAWSA